MPGELIGLRSVQKKVGGTIQARSGLTLQSFGVQRSTERSVEYLPPFILKNHHDNEPLEKLNLIDVRLLG